MDTYDRCTNLRKKNLADSVAIYGQGRELFRPPTYITIIFGIFFYGCETWLLTLREECWLSVFENWVLRRIFWRKMDKVTGEWRKLYNEELNDLYSSPSTVYRIGGKNMLYHKLPVKDELLFYNPVFSM
jgi:hypothetical protein